MRPHYGTLKAASVHARAQRLLLDVLQPQEPEEPQKARLCLAVVASVLILAACCRTSLTGACLLVRDKPSHRQVRQALYDCLPPRPRDLRSRLLQALRQTLPDHLFGRPLAMALDVHQRPYYGKRNTKGAVRGQKKASTRKAFMYGTLAALDSCGGRYNVGLMHLRPHMRLTTLVEQLLHQAQDLGLKVCYLMLDKEFYCAEVIQLLQQKNVPFLMPAKKKGNKGKGNAHLFEPTTAVGWHSYRWTTSLRRMDFKTGKRHKRGQLTVEVRMCVAGSRKKDEPLVYATWGLGKEWSPAQVVTAYRRRFGIEVQYRQMNEALARTSARGEKLRLLLVGLALLLCNLWNYVHGEILSKGPLGKRQRDLGQLSLRLLLTSIAYHIASLYGGYIGEWTAQQRIPEQLASCDT